MLKLKNLARLNVVELQALLHLTHPSDTCDTFSSKCSKRELIDIIEADINNSCEFHDISWTSLEVKQP